MANEADILRDKTSRNPDSAGGVSTIPIRKKGFYRALKRQVPWAMKKQARSDFDKVIHKMMMPDVIKMITAESFINSINSSTIQQHKIGEVVTVRKPQKYNPNV